MAFLDWTIDSYMVLSNSLPLHCEGADDGLVTEVVDIFSSGIDTAWCGVGTRGIRIEYVSTTIQGHEEVNLIPDRRVSNPT